MENTHEIIENVALDSVVDQESAQDGGEDSAGYSLEEAVKDIPDREVGDDDATMDLLKRFPKVRESIAELMKDRAENVALDIIRKGLEYDDAVADADKEGYLRGKNEKIELVKNHRMPQLDDMTSADEEAEERSILFPYYGRRSVWDDI